MENCRKNFYYETSDGGIGHASGYLYDLRTRINGDINDMSINLTIWEGRDTTGRIVAKRTDGEWKFMDD